MNEESNDKICKRESVPIGVICVFLQNNIDVHDLCLAGNHLGARGARYITEAMEENLWITSLSLADNNLQKEGARVVGEMLKTNSTLQVLDISGKFKVDIKVKTPCRSWISQVSSRSTSRSKHPVGPASLR